MMSIHVLQLYVKGVSLSIIHEEENKVKKFLAIILALTVILSLCAGCKKSDELDDKFGADGKVTIQVGLGSSAKVISFEDNALTKWLEEQKIGHAKVNYKLRDWVFSRQRYWGEPIPMIWCDKCGWVPMDEKDLPLLRQCRQAGDRYHAPVGGFQLVLPALYGPPQHRGFGLQGSHGLLVSRGLVQRRHGAYHPAPAVQPLLAQVPL